VLEFRCDLLPPCVDEVVDDGVHQIYRSRSLRPRLHAELPWEFRVGSQSLKCGLDQWGHGFPDCVASDAIESVVVHVQMMQVLLVHLLAIMRCWLFLNEEGTHSCSSL
jgi:hypothetical protein